MLKVVTLCSGYDSQCMALDRLGIDYDLLAWSEIDKYAIQAHNAIFPQYSERNLGDMTKINWGGQTFAIDLLTYSTPCQSVSCAGKQEGIKEGSDTASSILWSTRNVIIEKRPKYLLMENVKALVSKKFIKDFNRWQAELESYGYTNYSKVLNAKDYGVPQNRERVFMVSVLDSDKTFYFPQPIKLEKRLKDVLENDVSERYFLSRKMLDYFNKNSIKNKEKGNGFRFTTSDGDGISKTITTLSGCRMEDNYIKQPAFAAMRGRAVLTPKRTDYGKSIRKEYENGDRKEMRKNMQQLEPRTDGITNTITTVQKDNLLIEQKVMQLGNIIDDSNRNFKNPQVGRIYDDEGLSPTLCAMQGGNTQPEIVSNGNYRIRKLTERECFRLMGVSEHDIDTIQQCGISSTQQYKMAGNSIVVNVLVEIFRNLFIEKEQKGIELQLF